MRFYRFKKILLKTALFAAVIAVGTALSILGVPKVISITLVTVIGVKIISSI